MALGEGHRPMNYLIRIFSASQREKDELDGGWIGTLGISSIFLMNLDSACFTDFA
jgi:hypothetical protein